MAVFLVDRMLVWSCRCSPPLQAYVGHCGIIYSPSYLAGSSSSWWNQEEADSVISHQLLASSSPYGRLDASDSLSSTTSLQLRFNCWPNTRFLLFLHDLYTGSPSPPMHYKQEAHSTYIKPARWEFPLPAKLVGVLRGEYWDHKRNLPCQFLVILVQKAEQEATTETFPVDKLLARFSLFRD